MVTDPISDFLVKIKNAMAVGHESIMIPHSKLKEEIANLLEKKGFVKSVAKKRRKNQRSLEIGLLYKDNKPFIKDLCRVSKPSRRVYKGFNDLVSYKAGNGLYILSTPKGIITDKEAKREKVGGEVLFKIW